MHRIAAAETVALPGPPTLALAETSLRIAVCVGGAI
jgi:hypothetical protein